MAQPIRHVFRRVIFEWDASKAVGNLAKHGVRFEQACEVFFDPFVRIIDAMAEDEARDAAVGYTESQSLLFVVHLIRDEKVIRIVSARHASQKERALYEQL